MTTSPLSSSLSTSRPDSAADSHNAPVYPKHTIYVLVRLDIPLAQQLVQVGHAAAETGRAFYRQEHGIASLIVCTVADVQALHKAKARIEAKAIRAEMFYEPDFGIGDSALACEPVRDAQRKHFMGFPLWRPTAVPATPPVRPAELCATATLA